MVVISAGDTYSEKEMDEERTVRHVPEVSRASDSPLNRLAGPDAVLQYDVRKVSRYIHW